VCVWCNLNEFVQNVIFMTVSKYIYRSHNTSIDHKNTAISMVKDNNNSGITLE